MPRERQPYVCPHDPQMSGSNGVYSCPACGESVLAGLPHPEMVKIVVTPPDGDYAIVERDYGDDAEDTVEIESIDDTDIDWGEYDDDDTDVYSDR